MVEGAELKGAGVLVGAGLAVGVKGTGMGVGEGAELTDGVAEGAKLDDGEAVMVGPLVGAPERSQVRTQGIKNLYATI